MNDSDLSRCRSCGALITWRTHAGTNKRAPIDAQPNPSGNIVLQGDWFYRVTLEEPDPDELRYTNHFVTCPNAPDWRAKVKV